MKPIDKTGLLRYEIREAVESIERLGGLDFNEEELEAILDELGENSKNE
jgi:hypothetical protein